MADANNIKVAVRVRPFNSREKGLKSKLCIDMQGVTTVITDVDKTGKKKEYAFDYSFWSHEKDGKHDFADNKIVYNSLGKICLDAAFEGFNMSIFAYGQTGSGKSYSMYGYGEDKGIIPLICDNIFERIKLNKDPDLTQRVEMSMLEIYNERIQDLLADPNQRKTGGLNLRNHPKTGPYVQDLQVRPVTSYIDIQAAIDDGMKSRTVASTQMNATSSRAHTIATIKFTQTKVNVETMKANDIVSDMQLVDLAGSERAASTGASGARLKEGAAINQSLSALGNCISALAKKATAKPKAAKKIFIPYRSSVLTQLLQNSLGGNARTIMVAALSPASVNYDETLGTLRYADRAKQIKNCAVKNEDPNEKVINAMKDEIAQLRAALAGKGPMPGGITGDDGQAIADAAAAKKQLEDNERYMAEMQKSFEDKLAAAQVDAAERAKNEMENDNKKNTHPHFLNLHADPLMAELVCYYVDADAVRICRKDFKQKDTTDIILQGLLIQKEHANLVRKDGGKGGVSITPVKSSRVFINGTKIPRGGTVELQHNDRLVFGAHHFFRFMNPLQDDPTLPEEDEPFDYNFAQREISQAAMASMTGGTADAVALKEAEDLKREAQLQKEAAEKQRIDMDERAKRAEEEREAEMAKMRAELGAAKDEEQRQEMEKRRKEMEEKQEIAKREFEEKQAEMEAELQRQMERNARLVKHKEIENRDRVLLEETLMKAIPLVGDCTAMCEELEFPLKFTCKLRTKKSADADAMTEKTEVLMHVKNVATGQDSMWSWDLFQERVFGMQEVYNDWQDSQTLPELDPNNNPFMVAGGPQLIGQTRVYLMTLFHLMDISEKCPIIDHAGQQQGVLNLKITPIPPPDNEDDQEDDDDDEPMFLEEDASELENKALTLTFEIVGAMGIPKRLSDKVYCSYKFYLDDEESTTEQCQEVTINPSFVHKREITIEPVTKDFLEYVKSGLVEISIFGEPSTSGSRRKRAGSITANDADVAAPSTSSPSHASVVVVDNTVVAKLETQVESLAAEKKHLEEETQQLREQVAAANQGPDEQVKLLNKQLEEQREKNQQLQQQMKQHTPRGDDAVAQKRIDTQAQKIAELEAKLAAKPEKVKACVVM